MGTNVTAPASRADGCNYPLNCWWVAGTVAEITRKPIGRWLLDTPVVLYRTEDGQPVALENRCLHRWAPLSDGFIEGDEIVCPYHGARFTSDGRCVRYPTQPTVPGIAKIRSFAVVEHGPFVWIWLGDDHARAEAAPPPELAFAVDPAWTVVDGYYPVAANYMLFHENLLDLTHFNYLHRESLQISNKTPPRYWAEGNVVRSHNEFDLTGKSPEERAAAGVFDPAVTRQEDAGAFVTPAMHLGTVTMFAGPDTVRTVTHINHFLTPENAGRTHYWWHFCVGAQMPAPAVEGLRGMIETAFGEDSAMLASIQQVIDRDPRGRDFIEVSFKGDLGGLLVRKALRRILAAEAR